MYGYRGLWSLRAVILIIFEVMTHIHTYITTPFPLIDSAHPAGWAEWKSCRKLCGNVNPPKQEEKKTITNDNIRHFPLWNIYFWMMHYSTKHIFTNYTYITDDCDCTKASRLWPKFYKNDENDFERAPFMEVERGRDWEIVAPVHKLLLHLTTLSILNSENIYSAWNIECGCGFKLTRKWHFLSDSRGICWYTTYMRIKDSSKTSLQPFKNMTGSNLDTIY